MTTTLVVPDVHLAVVRVQLLLRQFPADRVIWLGDWFDDFGSTPEQAEETVGWLIRRMDDHPEDVFLWGNHDLHYRHAHTACSGFQPEVFQLLQTVLQQRHWRRFRWFHLAEGRLFTHAGLSRPLAPENRWPAEELVKWLEGQAAQAESRLERRDRHWLYAAGVARGGRAVSGGPLWCDLSEFEPLPGIRQVFGHTPGVKPRRKGPEHESSWCLDTRLRHVLRLQDGREEILPVQVPPVFLPDGEV